MAQPWKEGQGLCQGPNLSCKQTEVIQDMFFKEETLWKIRPNPPAQSQRAQKIEMCQDNIEWVEHS